MKTLLGEWQDLRRKSLATAVKLGRILADLKEDLRTVRPRRRWEPYVRDHLGINPRSASNYMRIWKEASRIDQIGEFLKSEIVSEMGIREMLNLLAETGKRSSKDPEPANPTEDQTAEPVESSKELPIQLADGSRMDLKRIHWRDGLITRESLESWLGRAGSGAGDPDELKLAARRERAVIHISVGINRAFGTKDSPAAMEMVESSFEIILTMLRGNQSGESV